MNRGKTILLSIFVGITVLGVGLGVGLGIFASRSSGSLAPAPTTTALPVTTRQFDDARTVDLQIDLSGTQRLTSPAAGKITELHIKPGKTLKSGETALEIDGTPIVGLATEVPLWRTLNDGDAGKDVSALQTELRRLGQNVLVTGKTNHATRAAAARIQGNKKTVPETINLNNWLWLPEPEVTIGEVIVRKGQTIDDKGELLTISGTSGAATITPPKSQTAAGKRIIVIDDLRLPVEKGNRITDPKSLTKITATPNFKMAKTQAVEKNDPKVTFQVRWLLAEPLSVYVLSPKAIFGIAGNHACVSINGQATPIQLVSSELGSALVTAKTPLTQVDADPDQTATCPS